MSKVVITVALLAALSMAPLAHANEAEYDAQCRKWAQEDEVAADQLNDYVARCIEDQKGAAGEAKQGSAEGAAGEAGQGSAESDR